MEGINVDDPSKEDVDRFTEELEKPLNEVIIDSIVVLQIVKHCCDNFPVDSWGLLTGSPVDSRAVQVTNNIPRTLENFKTPSTKFLENLRDTNFEHLLVGFYCSCKQSNFVNENVLKVFFDSSSLFKKFFTIVFDPTQLPLVLLIVLLVILLILLL
jgi:translation initiation factor 3 subunit H